MVVVISSLMYASLPIRTIQEQPEVCKITSGRVETFKVHASSFHKSSIGRHYLVRIKAAPSDRNPKTKSVVCTDCDGNGIILCSQCKGSGVNSVDMFNGEFKAGASCWLCGGKKEMLCGNCNGAGFIGGFMSTFDE